MKKTPLLFLFLALLVGCENSATDMDVPTESSNVDQDQLAAQDTSGTTIKFYFTDDDAMSVDAMLAINYDSALNLFDENIVCSADLFSQTSTYVNRSGAELAGDIPVSAKLELRIQHSEKSTINARVVFKSNTERESIIQLTKQGDKYVSKSYYNDSAFNKNIKYMFETMNYAGQNECSITIIIGADIKVPNPIKPSWISFGSEGEIRLETEYPVNSNLTAECIVVDAIGWRIWPTDAYSAPVSILKGQQMGRYHVDEIDETRKPLQVIVLNVTPLSDEMFNY